MCPPYCYCVIDPKDLKDESESNMYEEEDLCHDPDLQ